MSHHATCRLTCHEVPIHHLFCQRGHVALYRSTALWNESVDPDDAKQQRAPPVRPTVLLTSITGSSRHLSAFAADQVEFGGELQSHHTTAITRAYPFWFFNPFKLLGKSKVLMYLVTAYIGDMAEDDVKRGCWTGEYPGNFL
jgi:hypothetical protein